MTFCQGIAVFATIGFPMLRAAPTVEALHHFRTVSVVPAPGLVKAADNSYYGATVNGGSHGRGSIFRLSPSGELRTVYSFVLGDLAGTPNGDLVFGADGALYGTEAGGLAGGVIFRVSPAGEFRRWSFAGTTSGTALHPLVLGEDGEFYGAAAQQGANFRGTLFRFSTTGSLTLISSFGVGEGLGRRPAGPLALGPGGNLHAVTSEVSGASAAVVRMTPGGTAALVAKVPDQPEFHRPAGVLVVDRLGRIFGLLAHSAWNEPGRLFVVNGDNVSTFVLPAPGEGRLFLDPQGSLFLHANRRVWWWQPNTETFTEVYSAPDASGGITSLQAEADGSWIGLDGAVAGSLLVNRPRGGSIFRIHRDKSVRTLAEFPYESDGAAPRTALTWGADGALYGTTTRGGVANGGVLFRYRLEGSYEVLASFTNATGRSPVGALVPGEPGEFFGVTNDFSVAAVMPDFTGTLFRYSPIGGVEVLARFDPAVTGYDPLGLVRGRDGKLYGVTERGAAHGGGALFVYSPQEGLVTLGAFDASSGLQPSANIIVGSDGNFYGATRRGGGTDGGTIYRATPSGVLTALAALEGATELDPSNAPRVGFFVEGPLAQGGDDALYGAALGGGKYGVGTCFRVSLDGEVSVLHHFGARTPRGARSPAGGLTRGSDGHFYGTTLAQRGEGAGVAFRLSEDGRYEELGSFAAFINGSESEQGPLLEGADGSWYAARRNGGAFSGGALVRLTGISPEFVPSPVEPEPEPSPTPDPEPTPAETPTSLARPRVPVVLGFAGHRAVTTRSARTVIRGSAAKGCSIEYRVNHGTVMRAAAGRRWILPLTVERGRHVVFIRAVDRASGLRSGFARVVVVRR